MKYNIRKIFTYIFCFIILVYPFNYTIKSRIFPNSSIMIMFSMVSIIGLLLFGKIKRITKSQFSILVVTLIVFAIQIFNNYYFKESSEGKVIYFSIYIFLPFIIASNEKSIECFFSVLKLFCFEHIFGTFFVQIFKGFYMSNILPWLSSGAENVAYRNLLNGYNPGFTMHYSTNGIYLTIATTFFFSNFIADKKRKNLIYTCLAMIALLLTGKRAHTLFTIMACATLYILHSREKISKKAIKFFGAIAIAIIGIIILSMFVPQILNVLTRFEESAGKGELLSGREPFYELALRLWKNNILFGNGWGAFSYYFHFELYSSEFVYDYLDAHNVYLQLLCECGIIGLLFFISIAIYAISKTGKLITFMQDEKKYFYLLFSFAFQLFFLLYCFSGNPLYDIQCYGVYFICIGVTLNCKRIVMLENKKKLS